MGLLRAVADIVIVGAGTLRESLQHVWTAAYIYPPLTDAYQAASRCLGKVGTATECHRHCERRDRHVAARIPVW